MELPVAACFKAGIKKAMLGPCYLTQADFKAEHARSHLISGSAIYMVIKNSGLTDVS
jgi:hypothetical protein